MELNEIKVKAIMKGLTMIKLSELIGLERRTMYNKIKKQDQETIKKIQEVLEQ